MTCSLDRRLHQQDSLWSWLVCFTATFSDSLHLSLSHCFAVILPVLVKEFNETRESTAWLGSIVYSLTFLASPLIALCCKHFGCRKTAVTGAIACAIALLSSSFSSSLELMYLTYGIVLGVGGCCINLTGLLLVQRYFNIRRSLATGFVAAGSSFGAMLGPLYQTLLDNFGWRIAFRIIASWFVVPVLLALIFYSPNIDDSSVPVRGTNTQSQDGRAKSLCPRRTTCSFWNPLFIIATCTIGFQSLGMYAPLVHLVKHTNEVGLPTHEAAMLFIYIGVTSLIGKVVSGRLCDIPTVSAFWVNQVAGIIAGASMILLKFPSNNKGFVVFACFYGVSCGSFITTMYLLLLNTVAPKHRPVSLATGQVVAAVFVLVGAPFIGFLADKLGSYVPAFAVSGGIVVVASLIPCLTCCYRRTLSPEGERETNVLVEKEIVVERETVL